MTGFYNITTAIKNQLLQDVFCNSVTIGDIFEVDLSKQTIFPLSHIIVNNAALENNIWRFNMTVIAMDIVDKTKDLTTDKFRGNDNEHDVLNTQLAVLNRLFEILRRGSLYEEHYQLDGNPTLEPFTERFENYLAGWAGTFDVLIPNDMTACDGFETPTVLCENGVVTIRDTAGNVLHTVSVASGGTASQTIANSTAVLKTTSNTVISTTSINAQAIADIIAPDTTIEVNGVSEGSVVAGSTVDVQLSDSGGTVTPTSITQVGNDFQIVLPDAPASVTRSTATLMKTGQTTSYRTGDDGDLEAGRATDFLTLDAVPVHNDGSATINLTTNRFTDTLGGSTYTDDIVLDWSTWNGSTLLGWRRISLGTLNWNDAIDNALALSVGTFTSGWRLANNNEINSISNLGLTQVHNYAPFNITTELWSSTTYAPATPSAWRCQAIGLWGASGKANLRDAYPVRTFTVTGTTLS